MFCFQRPAIFTAHTPTTAFLHATPVGRLLLFSPPRRRRPPSLAAPADVLRALALVHASQGRHSTAVSLFHRAVDATSTDGGAGSGVCRGDDAISLCGLAQLLLTPRARRRPPLLPLSLPPPDGRGTGKRDVHGAHGCAVGGPEVESDPSPVAATNIAGTKSAINKSFPKRIAKSASSVVAQADTLTMRAPLLLPPSDEDKAEAARLLSRAFTAAGGTVPLERFYFGGGAGNKLEGGGSSGDWDRRGGGEGSGVVERALAEVHLVASRFSLQGRGSGSAGGNEGGEREWHLREAARGVPHTKAGLTAR